MNSMECYEILGISSDYSSDDYESVINSAYSSKLNELYTKRGAGKIDDDTLFAEKENLDNAKKIVLKDCKKRIKQARRKSDDTGAVEVRESKSILSSGTKKFLVGVCTGALVASLAFGITSCVKNNNNEKDYANNVVGYGSYNVVEETKDNEETIATEATTEPTEETTEPTEEVVEAVNYGDINDEALVQERAATLVKQLSDANIVNPVTTLPYTEEEIVRLIQYVGGIYVPETLEEINELYADALNLFIAPINTDSYLYHVVYASGNDEFKDMAVQAAKDVKHADFAKAFSEYGTNGVYPLVRWFQEKREAIYSTTDREEISAIYVEVGQVLADIMKGNGGTITVLENGKEVSYTFTSEQILANPASALQITTEAQLVFANKLELRDEKNNIIESSQTTWEVYNKFNGDEPDQVTLDEMQAWINNGCYYEWGIDEVLDDAQTFGQRIEGDVKGTAQNNYAMNHGNNKSLTK